MRAENHPLFPLVVVADCWLQRLLVWTPGQTDLIKTVALLLMVVDHISMLCGLDNDWLRLAGRGAFPLFGLVWAMNLARHPQIQQRALNRLWIWAGVAQGGWILAGLRPDLGNILFAFAVSGQALALMQRDGPRAWPLSLMLVLAWLPFSAGSYGLAGVVMLMLACGVCMTGRRTTRTGLALCLALAILALNAADSPAFAIAGLVIPGVTLTVLSRTCCRVPRFWPREFFPLFYAVHLAVIGLMVM
ncbi:type-F conjugative transfer system pilin acetylase TraX [Enterobacter hormaechei]|uniref:type-F conjugative transfer system pilin acetylase TraX n=1 Tax=Enterobacter hormaechei TaxID=158836 RepID=UPI0020762594|nr:type-F conjugative transfer system pilin acetylase TraX [Enterobacter hormaechei]MCM8227113.1 type-F conjugative transfer system pilin acetylase TraX [Enterobacter hormaechei]MDF3670131.1 type-F conjugative transfer system pilin acetylase TraX [Enterobacter hormaechei]